VDDEGVCRAWLPWVEDSQRSSLCGDSWSCSVIDEEKELLEVVDHGVRRWSEMGSLCQIFREPQDSPTHGLSLHCPCVCAAETRSAHPHSCSFRNRRAKTAAFVSPLLLPTHLCLCKDRGLLALGPCLPLPFPRWPLINALHINSVAA
jgi:hypothetical protein